MNDWLDYKGSNSARSTISHGAYISSNSKMTAPREKAREAAIKVRDKNLYDKINTDLDSLYSELNAVISAYKAGMAAGTQLMSAARNARAKVTIYTTRLRGAESKAQAISDAISNANVSDMQKTALTNKFNNMVNKCSSIISNTNTETDINWDTFESMINEINNNSKTNLRPRR